MPILDFQLLGWQTETRDEIELLVHCAPVGRMRGPLRVKFDSARSAEIKRVASDQWRGGAGTIARVTALGRELGDLLLPEVVADLLRDSLARIGNGDLLRIRLCLDETLIDLP